MPPTETTPINFDDFMQALKDAGTELLEQVDVRAEFLAYVEARRPEMLAFAQAGDAAQLQVMAFRFRTWARDHAVAAVRSAEQKIWSIAFTGLRVLLALGAA